MQEGLWWLKSTFKKGNINMSSSFVYMNTNNPSWKENIILRKLQRVFWLVSKDFLYGDESQISIYELYFIHAYCHSNDRAIVYTVSSYVYLMNDTPLRNFFFTRENRWRSSTNRKQNKNFAVIFLCWKKNRSSKQKIVLQHNVESYIDVHLKRPYILK